MTATLPRATLPNALASARHLGRLAADCLKCEVATYPKPGLVSHVDCGAHRDMDAALLCRSADSLAPFFAALAVAGRANASMERLREIGVEAERAMLATTRGVNTHRGALFGLGLLTAAAGLRGRRNERSSLGEIIRRRWGREILRHPGPAQSHGAEVARRHGAFGARAEAAGGLRSVYAVGLPALRQGRGLACHVEEAARVHACMALIASVADTNLLHRGGRAGLAFAQAQAAAFLAHGSVGRVGWQVRALDMHRSFVAQNLSPGGSADLLSMALFVDRVEA